MRWGWITILVVVLVVAGGVYLGLLAWPRIPSPPDVDVPADAWTGATMWFDWRRPGRGLGQARFGARRDPAAQPAASPHVEPGAIAGEYVLSFFDDRDRQGFAALVRERGGEVLGELRLGNMLRIRVRDRAQFDELLRRGPTPLDYGHNLVLSPPVPPGDKRAPEAGYIGFAGGALRWLGFDEVDAEWGRGITVAVLDSGVGPHAALDESRITRLDLLGEGAGEYNGHGTAVASLIAGQSSEVVGLAPGVSLLSIRVMDTEGKGDTFTLARGIVDAVDRGAQIINLSLGTYGDSPALRQAVEYAVARGVALVAASGNDAVAGVSYPGRYPGVLAVGAVDANGRHLYFSNRGAEVDLAAPGVGVTAAWPGDEVVGFSGTSAAVPIVSGALAMLLSRDHDLDTAAAMALLKAYADDTAAPGDDEAVGAGILNVERVLNRNVSGITDVGVGTPWITGDPATGTATITVYAENRGTETASAIVLEVTLGDTVESVTFRDVPVGETVSHALPITLTDQSVLLRYGAAAESGEDADPTDNVREILLGPVTDPAALHAP